jgi:hypothetical protein
MKLQTGIAAPPTRSLLFETVLNRIADVVVDKAVVVTDLQLSMGRTGLCLFLFNYYGYTQNDVDYDKAHAMLDGIYEAVADPAITVHKQAQVELGWLFMYLQNHDFIDIDADEILQKTDLAVFDGLTQYSLTVVGTYLLWRHAHTQQKQVKVKTAEAMINLVDEIRLKKGKEWPVREACSICLLLSKISGLGIYTQVVNDLIGELLPAIPAADEAAMVYASYTHRTIYPDVETILPPFNYTTLPTPYVGDLLLTMACLPANPLLGEKLVASINKNAPGHLGSSVGIPDLGLQAGLAGAGMALLQLLTERKLVDVDLLLMTLSL